MPVKIGKVSGFKLTSIGSSDYPQNSFRARYETDRVILIPNKDGLIDAPKLVFKYADLQDLSGAALGTTTAVVRPKLQAALGLADDPAA